LTAFVLDASIAACWAFADEDDPSSALALSILPTHEARAQALWWFELRNPLIVGERRGGIHQAETEAFPGWVTPLGIGLDASPDKPSLPGRARLHKPTIYDAASLELARRLGAPVATLDQKLAAAARAENVLLLQAP
jgi:hypothetical protein